jgi:hypothetical protein
MNVNIIFPFTWLAALAEYRLLSSSALPVAATRVEVLMITRTNKMWTLSSHR